MQGHGKKWIPVLVLCMLSYLLLNIPSANKENVEAVRSTEFELVMKCDLAKHNPCLIHRDTPVDLVQDQNVVLTYQVLCFQGS
jgi:uncharacterized membrane protein